MTWPEIKEALVRRWPERFVLYPKLALLYGEERAALMESDGVFELMSTDEERDGLTYSETELSDIAAICEAIGAVVESRFCVETGKENRVLWGWTICVDVNAKHPKLIGSKKKIYDSREAAELAALGEWLKATEDK